MGWAVVLAACATALCACDDFVVVQATATPAVPLQSLPPIGFNHRYGNSPVASADSYALERSLFAQQVFWEVGVRADPQAAGYVDRTNPAAVAAARARMTNLVVALATERLHTIEAMLAFPSDAGQETYAIAILDHFRAAGYSNLRTATVLIYFTEQDEHASLTWSTRAGYHFTVYDGDLKHSSFISGSTQTPLPQPG